MSLRRRLIAKEFIPLNNRHNTTTLLNLHQTGVYNAWYNPVGQEMDASI